MLGCIRHPNIVELLGASTIDEVIIVTSYCNAGSLFSFLHGDVHPVCWSWQCRIMLVVVHSRLRFLLHLCPLFPHRRRTTT